MKQLITMVCAAVVVIFQTAPASASVKTETYNWAGGDNAGKLAGTCTYTYPDERPMAAEQTIFVDKNTPDGTVLYQWGYDQFWSPTSVSCSPGSYPSTSVSGGADSETWHQGFNFPAGGGTGIRTSNPGIWLRLSVRFNTGCIYSNGSRSYYAGISGDWFEVSCPAAGTIYDINYRQGVSGIMRTYIYNDGSGNRYYFPSGSGSISYRAELVKNGTVSYSGSNRLSISSEIPIQLNLGFATGNVKYGFLDGSGFRIVAPACQLKTTNYTIPMNSWETQTATAYGPSVPVNLSLECSGEVDHVRFRFEDTGESVSSNNNITLYDSIGGDKIDGLEIEMQYNGSKVNVNNTDITDTGSHGTVSSGSGIFDSVSTAAFTARYVQNRTITRNGANYTGPVTGKVNMYVTYD